MYKRIVLVSAVLFSVLCYSYVRADDRPVRTIGVIFSADVLQYKLSHVAFINSLEKLGVDTKKIKFIVQRPYPNLVSWGNAARKLIAYDADIIVAYGAGAAGEVLAETSKVPVVYGFVYGPSLKLEKKNSVPCSYRVPMASFLRYLRQAKDIGNLGVVYSPFETDTVQQFKTVSELGREIGIMVKGFPLKSVKDIDMKIKPAELDALLVTGSALANFEMQRIFDLCRKKNVPLLSLFEGTEQYSFLTIAPDADHTGKEMAVAVSRLLKGEASNTIETKMMTKTKVLFNLKLTNEFGLRIPVRLVTSADKVIR